MKYGIHTIDDFNVRGKTVLLRVDINEPIDRQTGTLRDTTRIEACAPTIRELSDKGAKLVVLAHQGSDIEYQSYYTLRPHADILSLYVGRDIRFVPDVCGPYAVEQIKGLHDGEILLLDNVRFMAEEMTLFETKLRLSPAQMAQTQVVQKLTPAADLYLCDAFAAAHRSQPTLVGFEQVLPCGMGRLFEREYEVLSGLVKAPKRPCVFVLGGAKIQDAFLMMGRVLKDGVADMVLTGGLVANILLLAAGADIGAASKDFIYTKNLDDLIEDAAKIVSLYRDRVLLPEDLAWVETGERREEALGSLPQDKLLVDIGAKTIRRYTDLLRGAETIFINGPMGVFEKSPSAEGTRAVWEAAASSKGFSVVGGGDSISAANAFGVSARFNYLCTGGGALVRFLSGEELPVVAALRSAQRIV